MGFESLICPLPAAAVASSATKILHGRPLPWRTLRPPMSRPKGTRRKRWKQSLLAGLGAALITLLLATSWSEMLPLMIGSFGASAFLLFGFPDSGFCKPGRVVGAHLLCTLVGMLCLHFFGTAGWSAGLSVGLSITLMLGLRLMHPPAAANPLMVLALKPGWIFLVNPVLLGSAGLVAFAWAWRKAGLQPGNHH